MAKKTAKSKTPDGQTVTKRLSVKLTGEELTDKGLAAANFAQVLDQFENQFNEIKKDWKAKITDVEAKRDLALTAIRLGREDREVECTLVKNYEVNQIEYWYRDALTETREMRPEDRQADMFAVEDAKPGKTKRRSFKETRTDVETGDNVIDMMMPGAKAKKAVAPDHTESILTKEEKDAEIASVHREETSRKSKRSSVDRVDQH